MKKKSYSELLQDPRWQKKRLEILQRDDFKCRACDEVDIMLHVHHLIYKKDIMPWDTENENLITLSKRCHNALHVMCKSEIGIEAFVNVSLLLNKIGY